MSLQTPVRSGGFDMLRNVDVCLSVELGRTEMRLKDVMNLGEDSVVPLDRMTDELLDVFVNGKPIARAEVVTEGNRFALKIVEMMSDDDASEEVASPVDVAVEPNGQG